jgi:hypothetical protein
LLTQLKSSSKAYGCRNYTTAVDIATKQNGLLKRFSTGITLESGQQIIGIVF